MYINRDAEPKIHKIPSAQIWLFKKDTFLPIPPSIDTSSWFPFLPHWLAFACTVHHTPILISSAPSGHWTDTRIRHTLSDYAIFMILPVDGWLRRFPMRSSHTWPHINAKPPEISEWRRLAGLVWVDLVAVALDHKPHMEIFTSRLWSHPSGDL